MSTISQRLKLAMGIVASALLACSLLAVRAQTSTASNGRTILSLSRAQKPPHIDGTLNDPTWHGAAAFKDFKTLHPTMGKAPSERTEIYLTYDHENLYVGIHAFDAEPEEIRATATERDNPGNDDWVAFCVDSRDEELGAEFFMVTASGIQVDGTLDANGGPNLDFNAQWLSAARRTADGWTATMAIPFKVLPFSWAERVVMGFKVARFISHKSEEVDFPELAPDRGPQLTQFQQVQLTSIALGLPEDTPLIDIQALHARKVALKSRMETASYEGRLKEWGDASVFDYLIFPRRELKESDKPFRFLNARQHNNAISIFDHLEYLPGKKIGGLDAFLKETLTASFIVVKDDRILVEKYFNGYERNSIVTSFSVAKSFDSTLIGIAIDEGLIGSISDPVTRYLPELARRDSRFNRITIKDLLMMSSGIRYEEGAPRHDDWLTYLYPDLRDLALNKTEIVDTPGKRWLYNNYNPLLIGMIIERVTGKTVTQYLQEKIWSPLGMEYSGSWSTNTDNHGLEKMESGINARAIDFAKFGRLILNDGRWQGRQIVASQWIEQATQPEEKSAAYYENDSFFTSQRHYYKYFWWGAKRSGGKSDFYGVGNKGQYIYISPQSHLIIVRNGIDYGLPSTRWVKLFYDFATSMVDRKPEKAS